jgi:hypothetical protein
MDLLKLFHRSPVDDPETQIIPTEQRGDDLEAEFHSVILEQLVRGGVLEECVSIDVRSLGRAGDGRPVYMGMLRLVRWEPTSALRLLLGLPLLQARVRRAIQSSWMEEVTHFTGLWLHPSGQFEESEAMNDLRTMIVELERMQSEMLLRHRGAAPVEQSVWSVPQELAEPPRGESSNER